MGHADWTSRLQDRMIAPLDLADWFLGSREFQTTYGALDDTAFVTLLYRNVLDRAPDAEGLAYWLGRMAGGTTRAEVVMGFSESGEFRAATVTASHEHIDAQIEASWSDDIYRLYQATLDRAPEAGGFLDWMGRLGNGTPFLAAVGGFTGSREFQRTYGLLDDTAFVTLLYRNVLDRDPDAGGLADWLGRLSGGAVMRAEVVAGFSQSREFAAATAPGLRDFMRGLEGGDRLLGGAGANSLWGGSLADTFVFRADEPALHRIGDLEAWDFLELQGFGYDDAGDIRARMTDDGDTARFEDQGVIVLLYGTTLAALTDDMFRFS